MIESPCAVASIPSWWPMSPVTRTSAPFSMDTPITLFPEPGQMATRRTLRDNSPNTFTYSSRKAFPSEWVWSCFFYGSNLWMAPHGLQNKANSWEMQANHHCLSGCPSSLPESMFYIHFISWMEPACSLSFTIFPFYPLCLKHCLPSPAAASSVPSHAQETEWNVTSQLPLSLTASPRQTSATFHFLLSLFF